MFFPFSDYFKVAVSTTTTAVVHTVAKDSMIYFRGSISGPTGGAGNLDIQISAGAYGSLASFYFVLPSTVARYEAYGMKFVGAGTALTATSNGSSVVFATGDLHIFELGPQ